jgi:glucose 1-dehydrogenase
VLKTLEVTQFGVFHTCQLAAQQMVAQQNRGRPGGKIIIISSAQVTVPIITSAAYGMAKAAVTHLARNLAAELAQYRINVNAIHPGWIDTPGEYKLATAEEIRAGAKRIPWGRMGTPWDIGRAAVYLASDDADYVTGSIMQVDGGFTLGLRDPEP